MLKVINMVSYLLIVLLISLIEYKWEVWPRQWSKTRCTWLKCKVFPPFDRESIGDPIYLLYILSLVAKDAFVRFLRRFSWGCKLLERLGRRGWNLHLLLIILANISGPTKQLFIRVVEMEIKCLDNFQELVAPPSFNFSRPTWERLH